MARATGQGKLPLAHALSAGLLAHRAQGAFSTATGSKHELDVLDKDRVGNFFQVLSVAPLCIDRVCSRLPATLRASDQVSSTPTIIYTQRPVRLSQETLESFAQRMAVLVSSTLDR